MLRHTGVTFMRHGAGVEDRRRGNSLGGDGAVSNVTLYFRRKPSERRTEDLNAVVLYLV